jgi:hypothetical protein
MERRSAVLMIAMLVLGWPLLAQGPDTFTAIAELNGELGGPTMPVRFVVFRYTTDSEHESASRALAEGPEALHALFRTLPAIGEIVVNGRRVPLKYAYKRPENAGRTLALIADVPLAFMDPGPNSIPTGYDFTMAKLDFSLPGFAMGEISPAVKLMIDSAGRFVTEDYGAVPVRLTDVQKQ